MSLHGRDVSLREALDRLAAAAHVRLSYAAELLPLTRAVCLGYESESVGAVLTDLIAGTSVRPVAAGADQIVLAPVVENSSTDPSIPPVTMFRAVGILNRVVVTGSASGTSQRALPIALDVITGQQLAQHGAASLSTALDGSVPGLWLWEQSPLSLLARYGSIRGASSFGVSYPKVYIDGIEVANSLLVTHLDPDAISRIEVIRGPQGAALYGADAISGVINIITRQEGTDGGAPRAQLTTTAGTSSSQFAANDVLTQNHSLSLRTGTGVRSARLGMTLTTIGAFIPDAFSREFAANGGVRVVGSSSVITGTFRFFAEDARTPVSPLLTASLGSLAAIQQSRVAEERSRWGLSEFRMNLDTLVGTAPPPPIVDSSDRQSVRQYTLGGVATFHPGDRWTHSFVAGLDGYRLKSGTILDGAFPSPTDSALLAARGSATRGTLRASTVGQFGESDVASATVTVGAEYSLMRDETRTNSPFAVYRPSDGGLGGGAPLPPSNRIVETRSNTALIGQTNLAYHNMFFVSGGLRVERNTGLAGLGDYESLPMLGTAFVRSLGIATVKLRSAYGKGVRPAQTTSRAGTLMGLNRPPTDVPLSAEKQSGIETGMDVFLGKNAAFHMTRFDQRASGLIQPVSVAPPILAGDSTRPRRIAYELQNVGEISNRGWELEANTSAGPLALAATFSSVNSRVEKLAAGYTGDLRVGDRMLEVPSRTFGVSAAVTKKRWFTSWTLSRASDWVNYDRVALAAAFANQAHAPGEFWGVNLRTYWRKYDGVTRLGANFGYSVGRGLSLTLRGENLLDQQQGEPDNVTVLPGRTVTAGLRVSF